VITVAFFNNMGGVGKTTLAYHLAWTFESLGFSVLLADLDPQANLSALCLTEERLIELIPEEGPAATILQGISPILEGTGDVADVHVEPLSGSLRLVVGDPGLSSFEDKLSDAWPRRLDGKEDAWRTTTALHRIVQRAGRSFDAEIALVDVGPNLGAINRAALLAADHVVVPLAPDLFSLRGLSNLGPALRLWRKGWRSRMQDEDAPRTRLELPHGRMAPIGYVVGQHAVVTLNRPSRAYDRWMSRIPDRYRVAVAPEATEPAPSSVDDDPRCLATLRHYRSLMAMAMEARKPVFALTPADGALGAHGEAVRRARTEFRALAERIAARCGIPM